MSNKKDALHIKSNGLRNELKEIRKSIDKLTDAIILAQSNKYPVANGYSDPFGGRYTVTSDAQTHTRHEKDYSNPPSDDDSPDCWRMYDYD
jgi:hypothetical protein